MRISEKLVRSFEFLVICAVFQTLGELKKCLNFSTLEGNVNVYKQKIRNKRVTSLSIYVIFAHNQQKSLNIEKCRKITKLEPFLANADIFCLRCRFCFLKFSLIFLIFYQKMYFENFSRNYFKI